MKHTRTNYNLLPIGKTGEPGKSFEIYQGRRIRSTRLIERKSVMKRRLFSELTAGKGSKTVHPTIGGTAYLKELSRNLGASDEAKTCVRRLQSLWNLNQDRNSRAKDLFKLATREDLWVAAYKKLAHNKGALTAGGAKGTIDGTSLKTLKLLRDAIKSGTYKISSTRRVYIPKAKGGSRPLGIPEFRDRLAQEVIRIILECIYEPRFLESSHGFRPRRSQHTSLRQVRRDFGGAKWVIEGDISKCFDTISHQVVKHCLRRTIDDERFISLIMRGLRTKVLMPEGGLEWMNVGAPQGGVCSPLLSNIVLHQLDRFILRLKRKVDLGKQRKRNPAYVKLMNASRYRRGTNEGRDARKAARRINPNLTDDPGFRRLNYTRYADDFIIGITGPKALAVRIKELVAGFLKRRLHLNLNEEKTVITQLSGKNVSFLGYIIKRGAPYSMKHKQHYGKQTRIIRRARLGGLTLIVDVDKVMQGLTYKGFCKGGQPVANFRYMHQSQSYTVNAMNSILRGLNEYYKLSEGRRAAMVYFSYIIRYSIAKMFAAKYKLRSVQRVFKRAGKDLRKLLKAGKKTHGASDQKLTADAKAAGSKVKVEMPALLYTKYAQVPLPDLKPLAKRWNPYNSGLQAQHIPWPITRWTGFSVRGRMALSASCAHCGSDQSVEMHHVRGLKYLNKNNVVELTMIASRRKQVPLCRACHLAAHGKSLHR